MYISFEAQPISRAIKYQPIFYSILFFNKLFNFTHKSLSFANFSKSNFI